MNLDSIIKAVQTTVNVKPDGQPGPLTWKAIFKALSGKEWQEPPVENQVDERSERAIRTLHSRLQPLARKLVHDAAAKGITIKVTSGTRTYQEQAILYQRYREGSGGRAAPAGRSFHNFALAFDVTIFRGPDPVWESPDYKTIGLLGEKLGLTWGGHFEDQPHFELHPPGWSDGMDENQILAQLRQRHEDGKDSFLA